MSERQHDSTESRLRATEERFRLAQMAGGIGTFELDLAANAWEWTPQIAVLFGFDPKTPRPAFGDWERVIFIDDVPKVRAAIETATRTGHYDVEFRVKHGDGTVHWLAGKGEIALDEAHQGRHRLRGAYYEITERKALEARLLAVNETLEARVAEVAEEARTLDILNRTGVAVAAELDLDRLLQSVTDAGVALTGAQFGAFFFNVRSESGDAYVLHTLSGAQRDGFATFPMPRNTPVFEPTFRGTGAVRSDDIMADPLSAESRRNRRCNGSTRRSSSASPSASSSSRKARAASAFSSKPSPTARSSCSTPTGTSSTGTREPSG
jgi:hypothetical protein